MDNSQYVLLAAVIGGITEFLNRLRAKDYWVAGTIGTAALVGAVFGAFNVEGLNIVTGMAVAFGLSGSFSAIGMIRGKSTPAPSKLTER